MPEVIDTGNSQTMNLLEGYLNINPIGIGGMEIAIVDSTALESNGSDGEVFVDLGKSGGGQISVYVVRHGDTLSEIAEMFGVSTNTILWANDIKKGLIKEGQELVILPISGVRHVVKSGDTLKSIATKYKADLNDILLYNGLAVDIKLKLGDIVIIPDGVISVTQTSLAKTSRSQSYPVYSGYYLRPIVSGIKSQGIHGYNGVDLAAPTGTSIMASADGQVIIAKSNGYNGGFGLYVVIRHSNGTQTLYAHMSKVNVAIGQSVTQGQTIGAVGNTGKSTGSHLHFEVRGARNPF
ncbi:MAG: peptidoglycan DD-metalloendopeptidase family protein [bacterium]|nr:peptidoglycan DD-metalloendopeptidase family protein [bacterium]